MKLTPLSALLLITGGIYACSSSNGSSNEPSEFASATEAIRQLGRDDADVVQRCEQLAQRCQSFAADSGVAERTGEVCEKISEHCVELAQQLSAVREEFQACLERVAECEASDADPAECREQRRACNPAGRDFEARRGETLACAERTQSCLPRGRMGRGAEEDADEGDAGAVVCDDDALDFAGCCRGGHGRGGGRGGVGRGADAGARPFLGGLPGTGAGLPVPRPARIGDGTRRGGGRDNEGPGNAGDRRDDGADDNSGEDSND